MTATISNLVRQNTTSTGNGVLILGTVNGGYQTFNGAFGNGSTPDVFYYFISHQTANEWETGSGHMSDATTLVRDTVLKSSNANAAVSFSAGTKNVLCDIPSQFQVTTLGNVATATALQTGRQIDGTVFDGTANIAVIAPGTHAATSKATPVDADEVPIVDSAASNVLKKLTWANLKATLKTYFDTLYIAPTYTSTDQTITAAGSLTLAHGLGTQPKHVHVLLVNQTAELGYSINDVMILAYGGNAGNNSGISIVPDATNLNIRFGSAANLFNIVRKDTGATANITNANWKVRFEATGDL